MATGGCARVRAFRRHFNLRSTACGVNSVRFAQTRFGETRDEIFVFRGMDDGWAGLDQPDPIAKAMGDEKYHAFPEKMLADVISRDSNVYRLDKELSCTAPK
jgi:hypothetical protein